MFIVIDGIDGSGKGTQISLVAKALEEEGKRVKILDFPRYGEKSAFMVEKYLNGDYGKEVGAKLASIFYAVDRFESYQTGKQDLKNYDYILSNRYVSANMIHQAGKISEKNERENFLEWISDLEYNIFGIPKPDKTIFLNVSPEMSQKLVLKKAEREYLKGGKKMDLHEEDVDHLKNAHASALEIVSQNADWIQIDCEKNNIMRNIEDITQDILHEIKK
ncbi:MAG: deoxynucleoside kinase [Candidatus Gracilibacteria bacterium]|nr:deoxynucleoside kinase [Candidatus Gracilibacteria bacterium]